jgi:transcriptional regulator with XRE-family HTH domain
MTEHPAASADPAISYGALLRAKREAQKLSLQALADRLHVTPQAVHQFEKSETAGTISLRQLDKVARALGCQLSYSLRPMAATDADHSKPRSPKPKPPVETLRPEPPSSAPVVEHSLFLENQAADRFD